MIDVIIGAHGAPEGLIILNTLYEKGEKHENKCSIVFGCCGSDVLYTARWGFDDTTPVQWESGDITVLSQRVLFKRFLFMKVSIDGAALDKGEYRALIGTCSATLNLVK